MGKEHILRKLLCNYSSVKLVKSTDNSLHAVKIFKEKEGAETEYEIMKNLNSFWTIKAKEFSNQGRISPVKENEWTVAGEKAYFKYKDMNFTYLITELAENGDLFDFIEIGGSFPERVARYYFKCLVEAIEYLHSNEVTHNDIKLENLLLSQDFNIKLADFGLSRKPSGFSNTLLGTIRYSIYKI